MFHVDVNKSDQVNPRRAAGPGQVTSQVTSLFIPCAFSSFGHYVTAAETL